MQVTGEARAIAADIARRTFRRLPPDARRGIRSARSLLSRRPDGGAPVDFPADVADRQAVLDFLGEAHVFQDASEADGYLSDAIDRFRITMAVLPDLGPGARVLELGANPYFLTRLLRRRGLDVSCANYFGDAYDGPTVQAVRAGDEEREMFEFDHFNVELETFPYPDKSFDLVLFCEILEHLPSDPIHTLAEIHRVLAPDGTMLLTTPNATRLVNLLHVWKGENFYEELSGYGTYGRHNREYTVDELTRLLEGCGYAVDCIFAADLHTHREQLPFGVGADLEHRGDNLFVLARPQGEPRWHYPRWLFSSRHALRRIVRPDFLAGHNDVLQGEGFWDAEVVNGLDVCWMGSAPRTVVTLAPDHSRSACIRVEGLSAPPIAGMPLTLRATVASATVEWTIPCDGSHFVVEALVPAETECTVELTTDRTWSPRDVGINEDTRSLGLAIHRVSLVPAR